ncbi:hypothetical protein [Methanomassiliicoccus luminyensis]|uniref:hypothetical protein n=1 Tax=Methanomassiliicoccus luminyensis TaxID=1080712 RepID=UPI00035D7B73|nr:hypothetical protein [Methanomassiliicoccus luminyensis]
MTSTKKPAKSKPAAKSGAAKTPKKTKKAQPAVRDLPAPEELVEDLETIGEDLDSIAEEMIFGKNQNRTYALRDVWFSSLKEVIMDKTVPKEAREEVLFLTLTNALLDMLMDVVPKEMAIAFARNLDDYLAVTLVNNQYNVDLLKAFQDEFTAKMGEKFDTEGELMAALGDFEEKWWNSSRKELKGQSPNQALEEMSEKYSL